jgi:hypothetical protein
MTRGPVIAVDRQPPAALLRLPTEPCGDLVRDTTVAGAEVASQKALRRWRREGDAVDALEQDHRRPRPLERRERARGQAAQLGRSVKLRELRAQRVQHRAIALGEVTCTEPVEDEDLRVRGRRVEPDADFKLDAPRAEELPVDLPPPELRSAHEVRDLIARKSPVSSSYRQTGC